MHLPSDQCNPRVTHGLFLFPIDPLLLVDISLSLLLLLRVTDETKFPYMQCGNGFSPGAPPVSPSGMPQFPCPFFPPRDVPFFFFFLKDPNYSYACRISWNRTHFGRLLLAVVFCFSYFMPVRCRSGCLDFSHLSPVYTDQPPFSLPGSHSNSLAGHKGLTVSSWAKFPSATIVSRRPF